MVRASPGFPVRICGFGALHAAFLKESRTRDPIQCSVQEIRVAPSFSAQVRLGEPGAPFKGKDPVLGTVSVALVPSTDSFNPTSREKHARYGAPTVYLRVEKVRRKTTWLPTGQVWPLPVTN
jgi:hypothetical protein